MSRPPVACQEGLAEHSLVEQLSLGEVSHTQHLELTEGSNLWTISLTPHCFNSVSHCGYRLHPAGSSALKSFFAESEI